MSSCFPIHFPLVPNCVSVEIMSCARFLFDEYPLVVSFCNLPHCFLWLTTVSFLFTSISPLLFTKSFFSFYCHVDLPFFVYQRSFSIFLFWLPVFPVIWLSFCLLLFTNLIPHSVSLFYLSIILLLLTNFSLHSTPILSTNIPLHLTVVWTILPLFHHSLVSHIPVFSSLFSG